MNLLKVLKRGLVYMITAMVLISTATGCGNKAENTEETAETAEEDTRSQAESEGSEGTAGLSDVKIDYKTSEVYSKEDMDKAIAEIVKEFNTWEGCVLYEIDYTDDQKCADNLSYINSLAVDKKYAECIVFTSSFHSPVEGGGAWEADMDYQNWEWYLGRTEGGDWDLLTWGY